MPIVHTLILSALAGMSIALGGSAYLAVDNKIVGATLFTLGLFTICTRGFYLFTGKVSYALDNPPSYIIDLALILLGNLIGTCAVAYSLKLTRAGAAFAEKAAGLCATKLNDSAISVFILAIFCNILVYIAVDGFRNNKHELGKYLGLFLGVSGFLLSGFEHCIANMFYFTMAGVWSVHACIWMIIMILGNITGALLIPILTKLASGKPS